MAEDKVNTGQDEQGSGTPETETTVPGIETNDPPSQEGGDVTVNFETINRLMAERRAAAREEVVTDIPDPAETIDPPLPGDGDGTTPTKEGDPVLSDGNGSTLKVDGTSTKVIDFSEAGGPDSREPWEKTQEELDAEQGKKPRRGRPPKNKDGPKVEKPGKTGKGRPPKADKAAPKQGKGERDKVGPLTKYPYPSKYAKIEEKRHRQGEEDAAEASHGNDRGPGPAGAFSAEA